MKHIYRLMNGHYHKQRDGLVEERKYPCGVTNKMTSKSHFPITSTAANKLFYEKMIQDYITKNSAKVKQILDEEIDDMVNEKQSSEDRLAGYSEVVDVLESSRDSYNAQQQQQVGARKSRSQLGQLSPIFESGMLRIKEKAEELKSSVSKQLIYESESDEESKLQSQSDSDPSVVSELNLTSKVQMYQFVKATLQVDTAVFNPQMTHSVGIVEKINIHIRGIEARYHREVEELQKKQELLKENLNSELLLLNEAQKLLMTGIENNKRKIVQHKSEEEERLRQEMERVVNGE